MAETSQETVNKFFAAWSRLNLDERMGVFLRRTPNTRTFRWFRRRKTRTRFRKVIDSLTPTVKGLEINPEHGGQRQRRVQRTRGFYGSRRRQEDGAAPRGCIREPRKASLTASWQKRQDDGSDSENQGAIYKWRNMKTWRKYANCTIAML